jgi:ferredoxin-NADP reductase
METLIPQLAVRVARIEPLAAYVKRFTLTPLAGGHLPSFASGDLIRVCQIMEGRRVWSPYTLAGSPLDTERYEIIVKGKPAHLPGQSHFLFHEVQAGDGICISPPATGMRLAAEAEKHLLIAGGMGITAFLSHLAALRQSARPYTLHYTYRSAEQALFAETLKQAHGERVACNVSSQAGRLDLRTLLADQPADTHLYISGPPALVKDVVATARQAGWPLSHLHWDAGLTLEVGAAGKQDTRPAVTA